MSGGVPIFVPAYAAPEATGVQEGPNAVLGLAGHCAGPSLGSPTTHPAHHPAVGVSSFGVVHPGGFQSMPSTAGAYSMPPMPMWPVNAAATVMHPSPHYTNYTAPSSMMYMMPTAYAPAGFSSSATAPSTETAVQAATSTPNTATEHAVPPECGMLHLLPNTLLPAGVPFCPRGVPPTEEYAAMHGKRIY